VKDGCRREHERLVPGQLCAYCGEEVPEREGPDLPPMWSGKHWVAWILISAVLVYLMPDCDGYPDVVGCSSEECPEDGAP